MNSGSSAFISSGGQSADASLVGLVVPDVAARFHVHGAAGPPHHDHGLDAAGLVGRRVGVRLQRHLAAAAQTFVGGDHDRRFAIGDAAGERIRREAAEHHRMDGADARAGEHRVGGFRDHRHVDGDAVALLDAARLQHIGELADAGVQLLDR